MSLATRCSACGTVFRVVQDQLKISEGWVRCGRCEAVFNALESLFDLEREAPPPWPGSAGEPEPMAEAMAAPRPAPSEPEAAPAFVDTPVHDAVQDEPTTPLAPSTLAGMSTQPPQDLRTSRPAELAFLRRAEGASAWQRPRARVGLALLALLFGLLLTAQALRHWRDAMAARWPQAAPTLQALCAATGCRIEALRRVDSLAVESSGLTKLDGGKLYRLSVVLRNRDNTPILLPALDLTLSDGQGHTLARKVLRAAELGSTQAALPAGAELALQGVIDAGETRLAGYTVEIFYP
jgi:predicted Zn finger-like uncharacterized protein